MIDPFTTAHFPNRPLDPQGDPPIDRLDEEYGALRSDEAFVA